jgi:hypothetical protein
MATANNFNSSTDEAPRFYPWQPDTAPGVEPAKSLSFLRPVGPPPTGMGGQQQPHRHETVCSQPLPLFAPQSSVEFSNTVQWGPSFASPHTIANHHRQQLLPRSIESPSTMRDIAPYLDTGRDEKGCPVLIEASCPICGRLLEMPDHVSTKHRYPEADVEPLVVTPCGHLFGACCLEMHLRERDSERDNYMIVSQHRAAQQQSQATDLEPGEIREHAWGFGSANAAGTAFGLRAPTAPATNVQQATTTATARPGYDEHLQLFHRDEYAGDADEASWPSLRDCPMCRSPLTYSDCGCAIPLRPYNGRLPRAVQTPPTVPEGGAVPRACSRHDLAGAAGTIESFLRRNYPEGLHELNYISPEVRGSDHVRRMKEWMRDVLWGAVLWQVEGIFSW